MRKYGFALGCFFLGCVASQVSSVFTVPKALASQPDRFDYFCFGYEESSNFGVDKRTKIAETRLKRAGEEGWELASVVSIYDGATYCLKRRLP